MGMKDVFRNFFAYDDETDWEDEQSEDQQTTGNHINRHSARDEQQSETVSTQQTDKGRGACR